MIELPLGSQITVLVGIVNSGKDNLFLDYIFGSINNPSNFNNYIQNVKVL